MKNKKISKIIVGGITFALATTLMVGSPLTAFAQDVPVNVEENVPTVVPPSEADPSDKPETDLSELSDISKYVLSADELETFKPTVYTEEDRNTTFRNILSAKKEFDLKMSKFDLADIDKDDVPELFDYGYEVEDTENVLNTEYFTRVYKYMGDSKVLVVNTFSNGWILRFGDGVLEASDVTSPPIAFTYFYELDKENPSPINSINDAVISYGYDMTIDNDYKMACRKGMIVNLKDADEKAKFLTDLKAMGKRVTTSIEMKYDSDDFVQMLPLSTDKVEDTPTKPENPTDEPKPNPETPNPDKPVVDDTDKDTPTTDDDKKDETVTPIVPNTPTVETPTVEDVQTTVVEISANGDVAMTVKDESGTLPKTATMTTTTVTSGDVYDKVVTLAKSIGTYTGNLKVYEIDLKDGNTELHQLGGNVYVTVDAPFEVADGHTICVYRVDGDKLVRCNSEVKDGKLVFSTDHFSTYVFTDEIATEENTTNLDSPKMGDNNSALAVVFIGCVGAALIGFVLARQNKKQTN